MSQRSDSAANFCGVFDGLECWRERSPFIVAEVVTFGARGEDQNIVRNGTSGEVDLAALGVDACDFVQKDRDILAPS